MQQSQHTKPELTREQLLEVNQTLRQKIGRQRTALRQVNIGVMRTNLEIEAIKGYLRKDERRDYPKNTRTTYSQVERDLAQAIIRELAANPPRYGSERLDTITRGLREGLSDYTKSNLIRDLVKDNPAFADMQVPQLSIWSDQS